MVVNNAKQDSQKEKGNNPEQLKDKGENQDTSDDKNQDKTKDKDNLDIPQ